MTLSKVFFYNTIHTIRGAGKGVHEPVVVAFFHPKARHLVDPASFNSGKLDTFK
jgi:hypothetical protein